METTQRSDLGFGAAFPSMRPLPVPPAYAGWQQSLLLCGDLSILLASAVVALRLTHAPYRPLFAAPDAVMGLVFSAFVALLIYERLGLYRRPFSPLARDQAYAAFGAAALGTLLPALIIGLLPALAPYHVALALAAVASAVGLASVRFAFTGICTRLAPALPRRIAIAGRPERVDALPREMSLTASDSVLCLAFADFDRDVQSVVSDDDLAALPWLRRALEWGCETLIVTEALPPALMPALLRITEARRVKIAFAPLRLRPNACDFSVRRDGSVALLYPRSLSIVSPGSDFVRRAFDLALVIPALVALAPVLAAIALAIKRDSRGPVIYRQIRVGRFGREFAMLKFRTMEVDAERATGPVWAKVGETRVTRIGWFLRRTSLDELPQLINVLRGEMSIVGPRPERPFYVERFRRIFPRYCERHLVRPGITGWAQINMRRTLQPSEVGEKLSYDLFYLENWSIFLDVTILLKTAAEFLFQRPS